MRGNLWLLVSLFKRKIPNSVSQRTREQALLSFDDHPTKITMASTHDPPKLLSSDEALVLLHRCDAEIESSKKLLNEAKDLANKAGLSTDSDLSFAAPLAVTTTAGHSNTDHIVLQTNDFMTDSLAEFKRNLLTRRRAQQPEARSEDRWDKPRIKGERRRRIVREKDAPDAPPEPPQAGYVIFVGQMTTKIRHDRPNEPHNQTQVVKEISTMWKASLTQAERDYYNNFADEARDEYKRQDMEYRATGHYTPSETFEKVEGAGLWVRRKWHEKNELERELAGYESHSFPPRPPELDEEYKRKEVERREKRKEMNRKGTKRGRPKQKVEAAFATETAEV